uniref:Uncharacterized protein n=1 Tax=Arundo donax TaxID=35708 RepID=A0A0A9FGI6_ARUDO
MARTRLYTSGMGLYWSLKNMLRKSCSAKGVGGVTRRVSSRTLAVAMLGSCTNMPALK